MIELLFIILTIVVLDALISTSEAALLSVPRSKVEAALVAKKRGADTLHKLKTNIHRPLATLTLASNAATIFGSFIVGAIASQEFGGVATGIFSALLAVSVIIFGEILPKTIGERYAESLALSLAGFIQALTSMFKLLANLADYFVQLVSGQKKPPVVSEEEIFAMTALGEQSGSIESDEAAMIRNVFLLNDITVRELMTSRKDVMYLEGEKTLDELKEKILTTNHSRLPVVAQQTFGNVIGVAHQRDLIIAIERGRGHMPIKTFAKKPLLVPTQLKADELLRKFQKSRTHLAVAINEHGEASGVVTLEDCLEELVGELIEEKDIIPELIKRVSKNEILAHGETKGRHINSFFQTALPERKTLIGFLQREFHKIPEKGDVFEWEGLKFKIEEAVGGKVELVRITRESFPPRAET